MSDDNGMIKLPIIHQNMEIGTINMQDSSIIPNESNKIYFSCSSKIECCTQLKIPVTTHDIERIMDQGYELDQIIENLSPVIFTAKTKYGKTEKAYFLKQKPFLQSCTFLKDDKLCSIHNVKPFACRIYPFEVEFINEMSLKIKIHRQKICPSIKLVVKDKSNNFEILENILQILKQELYERE